MGVRLVKYNTTSNGSSGTFDHNLLENRDMEDQHPVSAISGLEERLTEMMTEVEERISNIKQTLKDLEDTTIVDEKTGQVIIYNSSTNTWENKNYIQQQDLPYPCSNINGQIVQYTGENKTYSPRSNFSLAIVNGYFYKCILDPDNTSFTYSNRSWGGGDYSSYNITSQEEYTVTAYIKRVYVYIDDIGLYTGLYETINGSRNYDGTTVTFTLPAGSTLSFRGSGQNSAVVQNITFKGTLYKWVRINVQPSEIDDINISETSTYSSTKIEDLLNHLQGKLKLSELSDTTITDPQKSDIIMYNLDTEQWENKPNNVSLFYNDANYIARHITAKEMQTIWDDVEIAY